MERSTIQEMEMLTFLQMNQENKNCENIIRRPSGIQCVSREEFAIYNNYVMMGQISVFGFLFIVILFFVVYGIKSENKK